MATGDNHATLAPIIRHHSLTSGCLHCPNGVRTTAIGHDRSARDRIATLPDEAGNKTRQLAGSLAGLGPFPAATVTGPPSRPPSPTRPPGGSQTGASRSPPP